VRAVEHVGVEVDLARPLDRARVRFHTDLPTPSRRAPSARAAAQMDASELGGVGAGAMLRSLVRPAVNRRVLCLGPRAVPRRPAGRSCTT
jgi:hypothetical protein